MKPRVHDPLHLDVAQFAADAAQLEGRWDLAGFARLLEAVPPDAPSRAGEVTWDARGELRHPLGAEPEIRLHLRARTSVWLECQRCLQPMAVPLEVERTFRFVRGEDAAARLDAESEEDVLELSRSLELHRLVEDELLLALPIVPRHERCAPVSAAAAGPAHEDGAPSPFAALQALKRGPARR
jgi:uncharacterized protein